MIEDLRATFKFLADEFSWHDQAACAGREDLPFFVENTRGGEGNRAITQALAIIAPLCESCPVRTQCVGGAIRRDERWGIWGGFLFTRPEDRKRARGWLKRKALGVPHGTPSGRKYHGCDCDACVEALRRYDREYQARRVG